MKLIKMVILLCSCICLTGCFEQKTNPVGAIAKDGSKYTILHQDLTKHDGKHMFLMCYLSTNTSNKAAFQKELDDLYGIQEIELVNQQMKILRRNEYSLLT
jgi:hypothetical protein